MRNFAIRFLPKDYVKWAEECDKRRRVRYLLVES